MEFPKSYAEMLTITHTHLLSMAAIFVFSGLALALCERPAERAGGGCSIVEPFVALLVSFSAMWLMRYVDARFSWLLALSSGIMAAHLLRPVVLRAAGAGRLAGGRREAARVPRRAGRRARRRGGVPGWLAARGSRAGRRRVRRALVLGDGPAGAPAALRRARRRRATRWPRPRWPSSGGSRARSPGSTTPAISPSSTGAPAGGADRGRRRPRGGARGGGAVPSGPPAAPSIRRSSR